MAGCKRERKYQGRGVLSSIAKVAGSIVKKSAGKLVNKAIDILPVELHIPGYQYCGPGTKLEKRLARGDPGINSLDRACKEHDIAYSRSSDTSSRAVADNILADQAWSVVKSADAGVLEKAAALAVTNIMKAKAKFGGGVHRRRKTTKTRGQKRVKRCSGKKGKGLYLRQQCRTQGNGARHRQCGGKRRR
ncbi:uncharacterized protein LOC120354550 [Nilaparvata lugens]|uniref:uncharacterized protein LOC120354550 n=1 Tax=Nilaparvata lugens TaxID=108931 RepID=UPI00193D8CB7|nr:uncharacterized protein LOC120354550 [Nilaparvata lugens]